MILTTINSVPGQEIEKTCGIVTGSSVQAKHISSDLRAGFKTLLGGEINEYTDMVEKTRILATERMIKEAHALGANGIVGVQYTTSSIMEGAAEILVYGTAVVLCGGNKNE